MQKNAFISGAEKQNVHEFCVFERYLLRKSLIYLIFAIFLLTL